MNKLYNKILKEAIDVMDFDSWDNSEKLFNGDLLEALSDRTFIYRSWYGQCLDPEYVTNHISILGGMTRKYIGLCYFKKALWESAEKFKDIPVWIEGKQVSLKAGVRTVYEINGYDIIPKDNENYSIQMELPELTDKDCEYMFQGTSIVKCPSLNVTNVTSMNNMFTNCKYLESVAPFIDKNSKTGLFQCTKDCTIKSNSMFYNSQENLNKKSKDFWNLDYYGSPRRLDDYMNYIA